jgi:hypothetical protein
VVDRRRNLVLVYIGDGNWHRFDLERLEGTATELVLREEIDLARQARCSVLG